MLRAWACISREETALQGDRTLPQLLHPSAGADRPICRLRLAFPRRSRFRSRQPTNPEESAESSKAFCKSSKLNGGQSSSIASGLLAGSACSIDVSGARLSVSLCPSRNMSSETNIPLGGFPFGIEVTKRLGFGLGDSSLGLPVQSAGSLSLLAGMP